MKARLILLAVLALAFTIAPVWAGLWPFKKEIPQVLCGKYEQVGEIVKDGGQKKAVEISGVFFEIKPKHVVRVDGETMQVETVMTVKKEGKTAYLVAFKKPSLSWILAEGDTPSKLAVIQSDKKDGNGSKAFVLERRDAFPSASKEGTSAVNDVND